MSELRRPLTEEEKEINLKAINRIIEENNDLNYLLDDAKLKYEKGLDYAYRKQKQQYKNTIEELEFQLKTNIEKINILKEQIEKGVIPKQINEVKGGENGNIQTGNS